MAKKRTYIAIDLKSFYASVECVERGLDPLKTNLVVADVSRTEKTICLAVSPSLKAYGIPGRARLFEVIQRVGEVNSSRKVKNKNKPFTGESYNTDELENPELKLTYITAPPQMKKYIEISTRVYKIYLKYVAPEDIHVYSIDEVFMDVTDYLHSNKMTPREMAMAMIQEVLAETGITATAGIGTNMYLCKVAMDIEAKHIKPDENGVRIAELDEISYRQKLWNHTPITDFWRIGRGYAKRLSENGMYTMGDIAKRSLQEGPCGEALLYKIFGINAELLIDHAWGWEPCTISEVKNYAPQTTSISSGQVLTIPYSYDEAKIIVREMTELMALDLVDKRLVTDQIVLTVGYDVESVKNGTYKGEIKQDIYGRKMPKHAHGSFNIGRHTSSTRLMLNAVLHIFEQQVDPDLLVRRITISANRLLTERDANLGAEQLDFFTDYSQQIKLEGLLKKEKRIQHAMLGIQKRYGKNAILKGTNLQKGATTIERNCQVGGHRA